MPRPTTHGASIVMQDVQRAARILQRVLSDDSYPRKRKEALVFHLNQAMSLLTEHEAEKAGAAAKRTGT